MKIVRVEILCEQSPLKVINMSPHEYSKIMDALARITPPLVTVVSYKGTFNINDNTFKSTGKLFMVHETIIISRVISISSSVPEYDYVAFAKV
jgi:hypothetical protein